MFTLIWGAKKISYVKRLNCYWCVDLWREGPIEGSPPYQDPLHAHRGGNSNQSYIHLCLPPATPLFMHTEAHSHSTPPPPPPRFFLRYVLFAAITIGVVAVPPVVL